MLFKIIWASLLKKYCYANLIVGVFQNNLLICIFGHTLSKNRESNVMHTEILTSIFVFIASLAKRIIFFAKLIICLPTHYCQLTMPNSVMALIWSKRSSRSTHTWPPDQNIVLSLHSGTMTVANYLPASGNCPLPFVNFRTKVGVMYSIESYNLFLEITMFFGRECRVWTLIKSADFFWDHFVFGEKKGFSLSF